MSSALTEVYVDPSIDADTGTGTVGDPYGDLQHAMDTASLGTDGTRFNIKAGTSEVLTAALDWSTHGTLTTQQPMVIQGYTAAAGDGGIGVIDGDATYAVISAGANYVAFRDMHLTNTGSEDIVDASSTSPAFFNVEFSDSTGYGIEAVNAVSGLIDSCYFHDLGNGIRAKSSWDITNCHFANDGTTDMGTCITITYYNGTIEGCTFSVDGTTDAIAMGRDAMRINACSFLTTGTGDAITGTNYHNQRISNCLFEGWNKGIEDIDTVFTYYYNNSFYDCTTNIAGSYVDMMDDSGNEQLDGSPFAKSGADTFANRAAYFAPNNVGLVRAA